jgi:PKHD-type hydroxylase
MVIRIPQVVSPQTARELCEGVRSGPIEEGRNTARGGAKSVKNNLQLIATSPQAVEGGRRLVEEMRRHPLFNVAVFPAVISTPNFSRYLPGMAYGRHVDAALMNVAGRRQIRTDISITVFLAEPETYEGGELVIDTGSGREVYKGGAGDCVIYPATFYHWIEPVRAGERIVSYFWVQSAIRSEEQRRLLFEMSRVMAKVAEGGDPQEILLPLSKCYSNLLREFAEP